MRRTTAARLAWTTFTLSPRKPCNPCVRTCCVRLRPHAWRERGRHHGCLRFQSLRLNPECEDSGFYRPKSGPIRKISPVPRIFGPAETARISPKIPPFILQVPGFPGKSLRSGRNRDPMQFLQTNPKDTPAFLAICRGVFCASGSTGGENGSLPPSAGKKSPRKRSPLTTRCRIRNKTQRAAPVPGTHGGTPSPKRQRRLEVCHLPSITERLAPSYRLQQSSEQRYSGRDDCRRSNLTFQRQTGFHGRVSPQNRQSAIPV